ncbi:MAG: hypothetical protein JWR02_1080 [Mucilaginibacter sp.]|nr:hypothetical protein [Mucilaginibacter sp.]
MLRHLTRNLLITITLIIAALTCKGQKQVTDKIYWAALEAYTHYSDTAYYFKSPPYIPPATKRAIYLKQQDYVDSIPKEINGYPIILITSNNFKKLYKEHKGKLIYTVMFPVKVKEGSLEIAITPYRGTLERNHLFLGVSDGITIVFSYSCDQQKFVVSKVIPWGI